MRTPSQTVGPFFGLGLGDRPCPDGPVRLEGRVLDGAGEPVADAVVEVWSPVTGWGRCGTDAAGGYRFALREAPHVDVLVFARGLLRPVRTRAYLDGNAPEPALAARPVEGGLRFDIHLQGERQTAFFVT